MKKIIFMCIALLMCACSQLLNFSKESTEYELLKFYAVSKLEKAFNIKIDLSKHFKAETNLSRSELEDIFGKGLTAKFTDTLSLTFENQKVRTALIYIKKDSTRVIIRLDRKPKT